VFYGMQAAFVEIGLSRAAFLHASDISFPLGQSGDFKSKRHVLLTDHKPFTLR